MNKAALTFAVLVTTLLSSGCVLKVIQAEVEDFVQDVELLDLPTRSTYGPHHGDIKEGVTPRTEIVQAFGGPAAQTPDGRFVLYHFGYLVAGWYVLDVKHSGQVLLEFDDEDRVKHRHSTWCRDPPCDPDPTASLLAMLEKYYGAPLVRKYQQWYPRAMALCSAANAGERVTVEELLAQGVDVNSRCTANGWTPLHKAAKTRNTVIVEMLLDRGADVNVKDEHGMTPLYGGADSGSVSVVELLLAKGANVNAKNLRGWTPLAHAAWKQNTTVGAMLLTKGADVDVKDKEGQTPLHIAAWGKAAIVELLLTKGADVNAKNDRGKTPIDVATDQKVIELLKQYANKK